MAGFLWPGLPISQAPATARATTDWLFSQGEVVIREGTVRWNDEMRGAPELSLQKVDVVLRNGNWRHSLRVDATPPGLGRPLHAGGHVPRAAAAVRDSNWQHWNGSCLPISRGWMSRACATMPMWALTWRGRGALRAWADVQRSQIVGGTADLALADVHATLGAGLQALRLPSIEGRLGAPPAGGALSFSAGAAICGRRWPALAGWQPQAAIHRASGKAGACKASSMPTSWIWPRWPRLPAACPCLPQPPMPLPPIRPRAWCREIQATWKGPLDALQQYQVRGAGAGPHAGRGRPKMANRTLGLRNANG